MSADDYPKRVWLMVRPDPEGPWHLHADGDPDGSRGPVRAACGSRFMPRESHMGDLAPSCAACRKTRLWRAIEQWEPADEAD